MKLDFRALLWLLKLGAGMNLFLIASLLAVGTPNPQVVVPGLILLGVSGFRCLFPNRYLDNIVFHDTPLNFQRKTKPPSRSRSDCLRASAIQRETGPWATSRDGPFGPRAQPNSRRFTAPGRFFERVQIQRRKAGRALRALLGCRSLSACTATRS